MKYLLLIIPLLLMPACLPEISSDASEESLDSQNDVQTKSALATETASSTGVETETAIREEERHEIRMRQDSAPVVVQKEANPIVFLAPEYEPLADGMKMISIALVLATLIVALCILLKARGSL